MILEILFNMVEKYSPFVYEVIEQVAKATTKKGKIDALQKHDSLALKNLLKGTYDDAIVWLLPDGSPPYTPADEKSIPSNFYKQYDQLKYFVKGGPGERLNVLKREMMFIRMVESIHPKDAELVLQMVAKQPLAKGLTKALVKEAYPNLISR
jgi:hypothetical protein